MKKWTGAAGVCVNTDNHILLVKQGRPEEVKTWTIPSGGQEKNETLEQCCVRELKEETGYDVKVIEKLFIKHDTQGDYEVEVHYFRVAVIGGHAIIQDPDDLIYDIDWKSSANLDGLALSYPQDKQMINTFLGQSGS